MPEYTCWLPEKGQTPEDGASLETAIRQDAAKEFVAQYERRVCEYQVAAGYETARVYVRDPDGKQWIVVVSGDPYPSYCITGVSRIREPTQS